MTKRSTVYEGEWKQNVDLHDIHELIEMGLNKEEISKELGISKKYVRRMIEYCYKDH